LGVSVFVICISLSDEKLLDDLIAFLLSRFKILFALDLLNKGKLISIDYLARPEQTKEKVGAVIPSHLRKRQQLFLDKATRVLKKFTQNSLKVDIFVHDSIHTYHNMIEEFDIIWPHIKKKGFLLSDDVTENDVS